MANFTSFTPNEITRWASQVEWDDASMLPLGVCMTVRNCLYRAETLSTRNGWKNLFTGDGPGAPVTATAFLRYLGAPNQSLVLVYDQGGTLWYEIGSSGVLGNYGISLFVAAQRASIEIAFNRGYIALHDGQNALLPPQVVDGATNTLRKAGGKQMGFQWTPSLDVIVGDYCTPPVPNGHMYRCIVAGTTGFGIPPFPTGSGQQVPDGPTVKWQEDTVSFADGVNPGNLCAGLRWMVVVFVNSNGNIMGFSPWASVSATLAGSKTVVVSNLPIGPANTVERRVLFTVALDSAQGTYFYIANNDYEYPGGSSAGILQTATVISDNVTRTAEFNFVDTYITGASDGTYLAKEPEVPPALDIYYSRALNRLVYAGINAIQPAPFGPLNLLSAVVFSEVGFPETILLPDNILQVGDTDGERVWCYREWGQAQMVCKEDSFFQVIPVTGSVPNLWTLVNLWRGIGICGPKAIDIAPDFFAFAHETGGYRHPDSVTGLPSLITDEIQQTWERINWTYGYTVWIKIDDKSKEVLFGVPLDDATSPSHILRCCYRRGWADPIVFSVRMGRFIPNPEGRKWSIDPIPTQGAAVYRNHPLKVPFDNRVNNRQLVILHADNTVKMSVPDVRHDDDAQGNPVGIDCQVVPVWSPNPTLDELQFGGCTISGRGNGQVNVSRVQLVKDENGKPSTETQLITDDPNNPGKHLVTFAAAKSTFDIQDDAQGEFFSIQIDNGASQDTGPVPDAWFELHTTAIYTRILHKGRAG